MRILLVNDYGTPTGGAELLLISLRRVLRARGHDVRLFTSSAHPQPVPSVADYECFGTTSAFRTLLQTFNPWAYWRLKEVLSQFHPHIVHVGLFLTQLSPLILLPLRQIPTLYLAMWYRTICPLGTKLLPDGTVCRNPLGTVCYRSGCLPLRDWGLLMLQLRLWHRWRDAFQVIVAHSASLQRRLDSEGVHANEVVMGAVPVRPARPPLASPPTIGFAGRLVREKGVDTLLLAFADVLRVIPEARLVIVGDGPERPRLVGLIHDLDLADVVLLPGQLPRAAMEDALSRVWVQVVPSRWEEPLGLAPLDAMMRGTAVIASNIGGLGETVQHGHSGLLVPPDDSKLLAEALLHLLGQQDVAERMGAAGRKIALERFTEERFGDHMLYTYEQMLRGRKSPESVSGRTARPT